MSKEIPKFERAEFNNLVDALMAGTTSIAAEFSRDPALHLGRGVHEETLLHFFAVDSRPEFIKELAQLGADLNTENEFGRTPLMESINNDNLRMAETLLELGADPNWQSLKDKSTTLHVAADFARQDAIHLLRRHGAALDLKDQFGETAMALMKSGLKLN